MKLSDERLDAIVKVGENYAALDFLGPHGSKVLSIARELRDYRKAVREYLELVNEWEKDNSHLEPDERAALDRACRRDLEAAEANLRALQERT